MPKKLTIDILKNKCFEMYKGEYTIIDDIYINNKTKINIHHNICGKVWAITAHSFLSGKKCNHCFFTKKLTIEDVKNRCNELHGDEYEILSNSYVGNKAKLEVKHNKCGEIFKISYNTLSYKKSKCPICNGKRKLNIDIIKNRCNELHGDEYEILSNFYINSSSKIKIRHTKCSNEWSVTTKSFLNNNRKCPKCSISNGEYKICRILEKNKIRYDTQKEFDDCFYINKLKFDFYLPEKNILIEFDGEQHFKSVEHFGGEKHYKITKMRDNIKNKYCSDKNIKLLRIPYYDYDNIENILSNLLVEVSGIDSRVSSS